MAHRFDVTKYTERNSSLTAARNAVTRLNEIINNIDGATTAQVKDGIKDLATYEKHIIKVLTGS